MEYSDCNSTWPDTAESRLKTALDADVARHMAEVKAGFNEAKAVIKAAESKARHIAEIQERFYLRLMHNDSQNCQSQMAAMQNSHCHGIGFGPGFTLDGSGVRIF